jgi:serine/threonine protein kinase
MDGTPLELVRENTAKRDPYVGRIINGRYQILKKLGEGGMGTVYLAEQISMARKVALKVLQGNYANDEEFISRFRREARLAASLNHPYIVTVYDFDQAEDGSLFIAMEYVDGMSLTEVIRRHSPLDIGRAVGLGAQIAEGLDAAHRTGVIHRDIKPDNIMVVGDEDLEKVKLMDFGIARLRDAGATSQLTRAGVIMGTPAYMAPEQAEGTEASERTDIYALGIVLYELLSGSVPFRASTPGAVLLKQIREVPQPLRDLRREIPFTVENVVMQALQKDPANRQRNMREVAQALKQVERSTVAHAGIRTMVIDNETIVDAQPKTIAATQISHGSLNEKPKTIGSKYLKLGVAMVVVILGLVLGLRRFSPWIGPVSETKPVVTIPAEEIKESSPPTTFPETSKPASTTASPRSVVLEKTKLLEPRFKGRDNQAQSGKAATDVTSVPKRSEATVKTAVTTPPAVKKPAVEKSVAQEKVTEHIKVAKFFRERGEYTDALAELGRKRGYSIREMLRSKRNSRTSEWLARLNRKSSAEPICAAIES